MLYNRAHSRSYLLHLCSVHRILGLLGLSEYNDRLQSVHVAQAWVGLCGRVVGGVRRVGDNRRGGVISLRFGGVFLFTGDGERRGLASGVSDLV